MKQIYYTFLNEAQIRETIGDAFSCIGYMFGFKDYAIDNTYHFVSGDNGLSVECFMRSFDLDKDDNIDFEKKSMNDLLVEYKETDKYFSYYRIGEESIKECMLDQLKTWKRTSKLTKLPFVNISIRGKVDENLRCLITASKSEISADLEKKIFDTKEEYVEKFDDLKVRKYKYN